MSWFGVDWRLVLVAVSITVALGVTWAVLGAASTEADKPPVEPAMLIFLMLLSGAFIILVGFALSRLVKTWAEHAAEDYWKGQSRGIAARAGLYTGVTLPFAQTKFKPGIPGFKRELERLQKNFD